MGPAPLLAPLLALALAATDCAPSGETDHRPLAAFDGDRGARWLLLRGDALDTPRPRWRATRDPALLARWRARLVVRSGAECAGTTPSDVYRLYRDGRLVGETWFCAFLPGDRVDGGELDDLLGTVVAGRRCGDDLARIQATRETLRALPGVTVVAASAAPCVSWWFTPGQP